MRNLIYLIIMIFNFSILQAPPEPDSGAKENPSQGSVQETQKETQQDRRVDRKSICDIL